MTQPINPNLLATLPPPVMAARRWLDGVDFSARPLINVSQAAPIDPPPEGLRRAMAEAALEIPQAHLYGPVLGLPELRAELARDWSAGYGGPVAPTQVAITSGCNQAFCAAISTLAAPGDAVILPTPWYFNHKMWLDMAGITTTPLPCGPSMRPDPEQARALITPRTRAIVLVTPNNPTGAEYPATLIEAFFDLARTHGLALILDETYRDFHSQPGPPHPLLQRADWQETLIQLYSFSKSFRLTGHRVGALITGPTRMQQVEKFLDTTTICPAQLGQYGALWGLRNLRPWLAGERAEILSRRAAISAGLARLDGWELMGAGAYFAYLRPPFELESDQLAQRLVREAGVLCLPGTMFTPPNCPQGQRSLRIAYANIDRDGIDTLIHRLAAFAP